VGLAHWRNWRLRSKKVNSNFNRSSNRRRNRNFITYIKQCSRLYFFAFRKKKKITKICWNNPSQKNILQITEEIKCGLFESCFMYRKISFFNHAHLYLVLLDILINLMLGLSKLPALLNVSITYYQLVLSIITSILLYKLV
jgi:hypothetical protein